MTQRRLGDVYKVDLGKGSVGLFQHVADDPTQLGSNVIRVFSHTLNTHNLALDFQELVSSAAAFHAHVAIPVGLKLKIWERIGNSRIVGDSQRICFRICNDYGRPGLQSSQDWSVWRIGMPMNRIGPLNEHSRLCEIGLVVNPLSIVSRIRTGKYDFAYPSG
jgi:hypothetical protein